MMSAALLSQMRVMFDEIVGAPDALPYAARPSITLRDGDRGSLDALERLADRAEGIRRHALRARKALIRERRVDA